MDLPAVRRRASIGARRNPETEEAILLAARSLLAERGYARFSVEEVARRAGAGKPTIYRWWPTKADLFISVFAAEKDAAVPLPDTGDLVDDLTRYTSDLWRFWRENPAGNALRGLISEAQASGQALEALRSKFLPDRLEPVRVMFQRAMDRGEIAQGDADGMVQLWMGFCWFRMLTGRIEHDPALIRRMMTMVAGKAPA